jgi:hypothetical protein
MTVRAVFILGIPAALAAIAVFGAGASPVLAQISAENPEEEEPAIELLPPNYTNSDYHFGMLLPEGYTTYDSKEGEAWVLQMTPDSPDKGTARLSVEPLPEGVTDVAGFWQAMKDRDPMMAHNATYEMVTSVAGTGAILARIERMENGQYILAILWAWVHDGHGFTLSGYPPEGGDNNLARDLAKQLIDQFRWMTDEEIAAAQAGTPPAPSTEQPPLPPGRRF